LCSFGLSKIRKIRIVILLFVRVALSYKFLDIRNYKQEVIGISGYKHKIEHATK